MPALAGVLRTLELDRLTVEVDLPGVLLVGAGEALDQRGLAGAVVTDDRQHLAPVEVEVDAVEADDAAEGDDQVTRRQDRLGLVHRVLGVGDVVDGQGQLLHGAHAFTFRIHWSTETATMTRTPIANRRHCWSTPASERPRVNEPTIRAPRRLPISPPRPPNRLVPPMTTAVMLSRLASGMPFGRRAPARPIWIQAREAVDQTGHGVDAEQDALARDTRQAGRLDVVTDREDVPAPGGLGQREARRCSRAAAP